MTAAKTTTTALVLLLLCGLLHIDTSFAQNDNNSNAGSAVLTRRVSLPKLSIYMLCENENIEDIDFEGEIEAYYNDLLTTKYGEQDQEQQQVVKDIELTATTNFDDCNLEPNMTQTRIFTNDGSVRLLVTEAVDDIDEDNETNDTDTNDADDTQLQNEIQNLVTSYSLKKHFRGICVNELNVFEVQVKKADDATTDTEDADENTKEKDSSFSNSITSFAGVEERYISTICNINQDEAKVFGITGVSIMLMVLFGFIVVLTCCFCCVCGGRRRK